MSDKVTNHVQAATKPDLAQIIADFSSLKRDFVDLVDHVKSGAVPTMLQMRCEPPLTALAIRREVPTTNWQRRASVP